MMQTLKMIETLAHGYSPENTQRQLFNEYQHDRVGMVLRNLGVLLLWTKVATALNGLRSAILGLYAGEIVLGIYR